jgi:serine/threonine protein kinase
MHQELEYGAEVDWWAVGVTMYVMLVGQFPFEESSTSKFSDEVLHTEVQYPERLSCDAVSLLKGVSIDTIRAEALGVPYSLLNIVFFHTH